MKKALLISYCGVATQLLAGGLIVLTKMADAMCYQILKALTDHIIPQPSHMACHLTFHKRIQKPGESSEEFVAALHQLALCYEYEKLEEALLDRFICCL